MYHRHHHHQVTWHGDEASGRMMYVWWLINTSICTLSHGWTFTINQQGCLVFTSLPWQLVAHIYYLHHHLLSIILLTDCSLYHMVRIELGFQAASSSSVQQAAAYTTLAASGLYSRTHLLYWLVFDRDGQHREPILYSLLCKGALLVIN